MKAITTRFSPLKTCLLLILGCTTLLSQVLEPKFDPATGQTVYAYRDVWGTTSVRDLDLNQRASHFGSTVALSSSGTNIQIRAIIAMIEKEKPGFPSGFGGSADVVAWATTNMNQRDKILGEHGWKLTLTDPTDATASKVKTLAMQNLDRSRMLLVIELNLNLPLNVKLEELPEMVTVGLVLGVGPYPDDDHFQLFLLHYIKQIVAPDLKRPVGDSVEKPSHTKKSDSLPEIGLTITKQGEWLLITCSPEVKGATLESVDLKSSPLIWRPVSLNTNGSSGWYVPPDDGARAFRVRLPKNDQ